MGINIEQKICENGENMDFDEFDDDFVVNPKVEVVEEIEENIEVKIWLLTTLVIVIVLHSFSDKWINWIVSLSHSIDPITTRLLDDIKNMKEELKSVSQVDDFAKYSKLERKILKARQELENSKGGSNTSRLQTKVAIVSFWRMLGGITMMFIMWNYGSTPLLRFRSQFWYPFGWMISMPTGVSNAVGIPFFITSLRTVISFARANSQQQPTKDNWQSI